MNVVAMKENKYGVVEGDDCSWHVEVAMEYGKQ